MPPLTWRVTASAEHPQPLLSGRGSRLRRGCHLLGPKASRWQCWASALPCLPVQGLPAPSAECHPVPPMGQAHRADEGSTRQAGRMPTAFLRLPAGADMSQSQHGGGEGGADAHVTPRLSPGPGEGVLVPVAPSQQEKGPRDRVSFTLSLPQKARPGVALTPPLPRWARGRGDREEPGLCKASRANGDVQLRRTPCGRFRHSPSGAMTPCGTCLAGPPPSLVLHPPSPDAVFHFLPLPFPTHLEGESERQRWRQTDRERMSRD